MPTDPATVSVLLPLPLGQAFDYLPMASQAAIIGSFVEVPFGRRQLQGIVVGAGHGEVPAHKLKKISAQMPQSPLNDSMVKFIDWVARYTISPPGAVLRMMFAGGSLPKPPTPKIVYRLAVGASNTKPTSQREKVYAALADNKQLTVAELRTATGVANSIITGMAKAGLIAADTRATNITPPQPDPGYHQPQLTPQQSKAAQEIIASLGRHKVMLLDGVTGAGKTEVYCEAIAAALRQDKQTLVMMPEIALTTAMIDRFVARFGVKPVEWHSALSDKQRRENWWAIAEGKAQIIVGARSALFLPYPKLGLITVDEEHDSSYKQEEGVIYNARDMAVVRAKLENIPIILASATPSLETWQNAQQGKYTHLELPDRYGGATLPTIELIDLRKEKLASQSWLSPTLVNRLKQTIAGGKQAMLFLNRRGYAPLTLCRSCGHRLQCPNCSAWLVQHKHSSRLQCHHCGHQATLPPHCPACNAEGKFAACGPGVERMAEEVAVILPDIRFAVLASDTVNHPKDIQSIITRMHDRQLDLLIGTQIIAKGYHFPDLTMVGVIDADLGLSGGDPRAAERVFQLLQQVAGRSGRAETPGVALVQTLQPQHPVMLALQKNNRNDFLTAEMAERKQYQLPPFVRLAAFIISAANVNQATGFARKLAQSAPTQNGLTILGPAPAPIAMLRGKHRQRLLIRCQPGMNLQKLIQQWLADIKIPAAIKLQIDIDPYSFM